MAPYWIANDRAALWGLNILLQVTLVAIVTLGFAGMVRRRVVVCHAVLILSLAVLLLAPVIALVMQTSNRTLLGVSLSGQSLFASHDKTVATESTIGAPSGAASGDKGSTQRTSTGPIRGHVRQTASPEQSARNARDGSIAPDKDDRSAGMGRPAESPTLPIAAVDQTIPEAMPPSSATTLLRQILPPVLSIWLFGSLLLVFRAAAGWYRLAAVLRRARPVSASHFIAPLEGALQSLGVQGTRPTLLVSPEVASPLAAGLWRPRVVLPEAIPAHVTSDQLQQILVHEIAHVVRRDPAVVLLQHIVAVLFWLHPLVHVLNRRLAKAREEVCDNYVLGTTDAPTYSRTLLLLAEMATTARPLPGSVPLFTSRWRLESRIAGILDERRNLTTRLTARGKALVIATSLLAATGAAGATISPIPAPTAVAAEENPLSRIAPLAPGDDGVDVIRESDLVREVTKQFDFDPRPDHFDFDRQRFGGVPRAVAVDSKPDSVRSDETKAKIALLDTVAAGAKASYERIQTWKGSGEYRAMQSWEDGPRPYKLQVRRLADIRFAVDQKAKALCVDWDEREPVRLVGAEHPAGQLLTTDLNHFQSIMTADNWLDFRTARRFPTRETPLLGFDSSREPRVVVVRSPFVQEVRLEPDGLIDPRLWTGLNGRQFQSERQFFWQEHEWLKEIDEQSRRAGKPARAFDNCDVIREAGEAGAVVLVRTIWTRNGKPDPNDPLALRRELAFEERFGYALTRQEHWIVGRMHEKAVIEYEKRGPAAVPVRFTRTVSDGQRHTEETLEVRLAESQINVPLDPSRFAVESLHLKEGDRVLDENQKRSFVITKGKQVPVPEGARSGIRWTSQASTSLATYAFAGREWNDLVHAYADLSNTWRHSKPQELPLPERKRAYAQNRAAWEQLARRHIALHPLLDERRRSALHGLNCLAAVIRMEYAGPVADEAAAIILRDHSLAQAQPFFAKMLGYSLPPSLAAETVLRGMLQQSESRATQAQARMSLARFLVDQSERARLIRTLPGRAERVADEYGDAYLRRLRQIDPDQADREAETLWKEVIDKFLDVADDSDKVMLSVQASRDLLRLHHTLGRKAPEIVGNDFDGKPMKLSDSDGRVRVLMFWGNWCPPCRRHYPHLRQLMAKYANASFAVLGVCSDERKDQIRQAVEDGSVTWRFWWDGNDDRWRIHREWGLAGSPWFFVLDRKGVVRFAEVKGTELDAAVELLLNEKTGSAE